MLDFSDYGKNLKSQLSWLSLRDASTARSIISTIAAGILSLSVFSFSMVMILLNQAASQMSNRMLDFMIGNRFQQVVLGFYIGTIVYALFLLSTIRDISSGIYVPALSIYILILLSVVDIFLFIYFLHYITQSVKYTTIIERIHGQTIDSLHNLCETECPRNFTPPDTKIITVKMPKSDYYQGFNEKELVKFAKKKNATFEFIYPVSSYLLKGTPLLYVYTNDKFDDSDIDDLLLLVDSFRGNSIKGNPYYGYHQLAEVAIKALSPGINDPETAVLSLEALTNLFLYQINHYIPSLFSDEDGVVRVKSCPWTFEMLFYECYYPIWDYGKNDRYAVKAMYNMMQQLKINDTNGNQTAIINTMINLIKQQKLTNHF